MTGNPDIRPILNDPNNSAKPVIINTTAVATPTRISSMLVVKFTFSLIVVFGIFLNIKIDNRQQVKVTKTQSVGASGNLDNTNAQPKNAVILVDALRKIDRTLEPVNMNLLNNQ